MIPRRNRGRISSREKAKTKDEDVDNLVDEKVNKVFFNILIISDFRVTRRSSSYGRQA